MLLRLRTPATNDRGPLYAEQAFAALHQANAQRLPLRLIFGIHAGSVGLFVAAPNILQSLVETQFYANYPDCTLDRLAGDTFDSTSGEEILHMDLLLVPDLFPFRRYAQFEDGLNRVTADPLMGIPQRHLDQKALAAASAIARALDRMIALEAHFALIRIMLAVFIQLMFGGVHADRRKAEQAITERPRLQREISQVRASSPQRATARSSFFGQFPIAPTAPRVVYW